MRILYGLDAEAREAQLLSELQEVLAAGRAAVLLVPEQYTLEMERRVAGTLRNVPRARLEIQSFNRLAHQLVDSRRGLTRRPVDPVGRLLALQRIMLEQRDTLKTYGRVAAKPAFAREVDQLIKELKLNAVGPEVLDGLCRSAGETELLTAKLEDLVRIYRAYEGWLSEGWMDEADRLKALLEALETRRPFAGKPVWFHGFRSFTGLEWGLIQALHGQSPELCFTLTLHDPEGRGSVMAPVLKTLARLEGLCHGREPLRYGQCGEKEANRVGRRILMDQAEASEGVEPAVTCWSAANPHREVEQAALVLTEWVRSEGWHWRDLMVVTPADPSWQRSFGRVCDKMGIPVFLDNGRPLGQHPFCRYVTDLIRAAAGGLEGQAVCRALKWGYYPADRDLVDRLETYVLARGIRRGRWGRVEGADPDVAALMNRIQESFAPLAHLLKASATVRSVLEGVRTFLEATGAYDALRAEEDRLLREERWDEAREQGEVLEALESVFHQLESTLGPESLSPAILKDLLRTGMESVEIGRLPSAADQVSVGTLFRSRSGSIQGLLILGANEGQLPSYDSGDGLLLNDEKLLLKQWGVPLDSDGETRGSEEEFALLELLGKVKGRLGISCALYEGTGERLQPSWFFERAQVLWPDRRPPAEVGAAGASQLPPPILLEQLADRIRNRLPLPVDPEGLEQRLAGHPRWEAGVRAILDGGAHRYQMEPLPSEIRRGLIGDSCILDATGLERYTRCPFSWFVRHVLKPEPRRRYEVTVPDVGTLFHQVVDRFMEQAEDRWTEWPEDRIGAFLEPMVERMAQEYGNGVLEDTARNRYLKRKILRLGTRALSTLAMQLQAADFEVKGTELAFDVTPRPGSLPPLVLETEAGNRLVVRGRIDRVDLCRLEDSVYGRIVDYKSGRPRFTLSDLAHGLELQLAIYLDVLSRNGQELAPEGVVPAGFLYFYLDDPMIDTREESEQELRQAIYRELRMEGLLLENREVLEAMDGSLEATGSSSVIPVSLKQDGSLSSASSTVSLQAMKALLDYAEGIILRNGSAILEGRFPVSPCQTEQGMACRYCDFSAFCQYDPSAEESPRRFLGKLDNRTALKRILGGEETDDHAMDS